MNILDKTRLLQTSVLSSLIMGMGGVAYAQVEQTPEAIEDEFAEEDNIVVTGSRIRRPDLDTVFPTTFVDSEALDKSAFTNVADALSEIPAFGGSITPAGNQGDNVGGNFVDFLDLGTQRTLTLVNGRRFVSGDVGGTGLSVDFNVIPLALVERIDTIGVGGAPIYGSDAIAGTINVILKDDFEGLEATALYGQTEQGDADRRQFQIVAGANTEDGRGNVTFSAEYSKNEGLLDTARPSFHTGNPEATLVGPGNEALGFADVDFDGDGTPDRIFRPLSDVNIQLFTAGGTISNLGQGFLPSFGSANFGGFSTPQTNGVEFYQFDDSGTLVPYIAGARHPSSSIRSVGGTPFDFFDLAGQVQSPVERIVLGSSARYEITDNIEFKSDLQFANTKARELTNQGGFQTGFFDGLSAAIEVPVSNPFLGAENRDLLTNRLGFDADDSFLVHRFNNNLNQDGSRDSESSLWRIAAGLEGEFELAGRKFNWDAYGVAGQNTNINNTAPLINNTRFLNAVEAVVLTAADVTAIADAGNNPIGEVGDIVCQSTRDYFQFTRSERFDPTNADVRNIRGVVSGSGLVDTDPRDVIDCQPLNLFGDGNASSESLDYIVQRGLLTNDIEQRIWSANFTGELIELPAGWASFAVGYETRQETALFASGGAAEAGIGRSAGVPDTGGTYSTDEFLGEVYLPIISPDMDIPLVHNLQAEASIREISNTLAGDATVWTVGGSYTPLEGFTLRGNKTRSVRAPSLTELFAPITTSFQFANDPCDQDHIVRGNTANREANCAAIGIDLNQVNANGSIGFISDVDDGTAQGRSGGNPNLRNEIADSFTIGGVYQPHFVSGLTLTADYINIDLADRIGAQSLENNMESCFDSDPADFASNPACSTFTRDANFQVVDFLSGQANADSAEYQFLNIKADYRFEVADLFDVLGGNGSGDLGEMSLRTDAFHVIQRDLSLGGVPQDNTIGLASDPKWSGTIDATYTKSGFRFFWRTLWQDKALFEADLERNPDNIFATADGIVVADAGWRVLHNASVSYDISTLTDNYDKPLIVQFNVDNVLNRRGTNDIDRTFGNFGLSEELGRRFTMRVRASF